MLLHSADIVINPRAGQAAFALAIVGISPPPLPAETGQKKRVWAGEAREGPRAAKLWRQLPNSHGGREGSRLNIALSLFFAPSLLCGALLNRLFIVAVAGGGGEEEGALAHPGSRGRGGNSTFWTILLYFL